MLLTTRGLSGVPSGAGAKGDSRLLFYDERGGLLFYDGLRKNSGRIMRAEPHARKLVHLGFESGHQLK